MSVKIEQLTGDNHYSINGKQAIKDANGCWVTNEELTPSEQKACREHLQATEKQTEPLNHD